MLDINDLLMRANETEVSHDGPNGSGNSKPSFGIVNSRHNGKRFSFSKALSEELGLTDYVEFQPSGQKVLLISKALGIPKAMNSNLCGEDGKKIAYCSGHVAALSKFYNLDFTKRTSRSFDRITFATSPVTGEKIAVVVINQNAQIPEPVTEE